MLDKCNVSSRTEYILFGKVRNSYNVAMYVTSLIAYLACSVQARATLDDIRKIQETMIEEYEKDINSRPWSKAAKLLEIIAKDTRNPPEVRLQARVRIIWDLSLGNESTKQAYSELARLANLKGMASCIANVKAIFATWEPEEIRPAFGLCDAILKQAKDPETKAGALFGKAMLYPRGSKEQVRYFTRAATEFKGLRYGLVSQRYLDELKHLEVGNTMPDFDGKDSAGAIIKLSSYRGKFVLLDCWASWCGPCMQLLPHTIEISKKYADQLSVIGIGGDEDLTKQKMAESEKGTTFPTIFSGGYNKGVPLKLNVVGWPTYYLLSPEGKILEKWAGGASERDLDAKLAKHLGR